MSGDRWREIDGLLRRAMEIPQDARPAFVATEAGEDPELRRAVQDMLEALREAEPFLERSAEDLWDLSWESVLPAPAAEDRAPDGGLDRSGELLGPWRLLRRLGRGGMATVYLAERADGLWQQQVAIKVLRRGLDTEDVVGRFHAERQILSSLDHPNIARLLDGGSTEDGLPYLVMEYVDGVPITRYCDDRRLSIDERLELFRHVGRAVQGAHRHLVVHRDLKPSNILVDAEGRVKLLDFGIAKILDPVADGDQTRTGLRPLTLSCASPEQVTGGAVTTASDVYQLGLLLCELLAGARPYQVGGLSPARTERAITEARPRRPSALITVERASARAGTASELARRLSGDLDLIVLHALRKEPEERFESVASLVDDVTRHLEGEPVSVQSDTIAYRTGKFVRRHRAGVTAATVVGLLLAASATVSLVQADRAERERDRARAEAQRAAQVTGFISELFRSTDPNEVAGETITAMELLDVGADRALRYLDDDPRTQAEILSAIGGIYVIRGRFDEAAPLYRRSIERRRQAGGDPEGLVADLGSLGYIVGRNDVAAGNALLAEAVALAERTFSPDDPRLAEALVDYAAGRMKEPASDPAEWHALLDRAIPIFRGAEGDHRAQLARALQLSAYGPGGIPENYAKLEAALTLRRSLHGDEHTSVAIILNEMALAIQTTDPYASDTLLERAIAINERILGPDHAHTIQMMSNLAGKWRDRGEFERSAPMYRELLSRRREAYPADSMGHAFIMHGLGWSLTELGRPEEAEPILRDVLEILAAHGHDERSAITHMGRSTLGRAIAEQDRYQEAEPLLRGSFDWMRENSPRPLYLEFMRQRLVELYEDWGRPGLAGEIVGEEVGQAGQAVANEASPVASASPQRPSDSDL